MSHLAEFEGLKMSWYISADPGVNLVTLFGMLC